MGLYSIEWDTIIWKFVHTACIICHISCIFISVNENVNEKRQETSRRINLNKLHTIFSVNARRD